MLTENMDGWIGGQADYVMVPYADFNLLKFPDKAQAMEKIRDLTCLSDILPTGFHGAVTARSASDRRSTSPAQGRSAWRPQRPRTFLARQPC
jgi:threonine dehydrogenase-like Zn-dependent dehydrogenase